MSGTKKVPRGNRFWPVAGDGITVEAEEPYEQDGQLVFPIKHYITDDDTDYSLRWLYVDPTSDDLISIKSERHRKDLPGKRHLLCHGKLYVQL